MLFNSIHFLIFFPVVTLVYFVIPQRIRYLWLLGASYYFYMCWNPEYALLIAASTVATYASGLLMQMWRGKGKNRWARWCLVGCLAFNLAILFFFKYYHFAAQSLQAVFGWLGASVTIPAFDVLLPVGISFYTFQALSYVVDVYRGEIDAEKNILRYALFVSFFPQLVAGPIERSKNLLSQMHESHHFDARRVKDGLLLMGWGFIQKMVIADRIAIVVTEVYSHYTLYTGVQIVWATILFAFQIYCDFAGYSDIAVGAARVMGFDLMKNFRQPYFATSVSSFWRSWHISLTTWFRDYVYIPLGGNRHGRLRKYRNLFVTFCISGLWHGASWNYVVWGALNGLYQIMGEVTKPLRHMAQRCLRIRTQCWSYRLFQRLVTFALVDFAWLFFRAESCAKAIEMIRHSLRNIGFASILNINRLVLSEEHSFVMFAGLAGLLVVDYLRSRMNLKAALAGQNAVFRYAVYYLMVLVILVFGVYGPGYDAAAFIYFQF